MSQVSEFEAGGDWATSWVPPRLAVSAGFQDTASRWIAVTLWWVLMSRASLDDVFGLVPLGGSGMTLGVVMNVIVLGAGALSLAILPPRLTGLAVLVWGPYLAWLTITLVWSSDRMEGFRLLLNILSYAAIFAMGLISTACQVSLRRLIEPVMLSASLPLFVGSVQAIASHGGRISGTFPHPNIFAMYLLAIIAISLWLLGPGMRRSAPRSRICMLVVVLASSVVMILMTQTRSAWTCAAILFVMFGALVERRALLALPLAGLILLLPPVQARLSDLNGAKDVPDYLVTSGQVSVDSYAWRKMLWRDGMADSQDHRIAGEGIGSFNFNSQYFFPVAPGTDSHNVYVQTIYEAGLIGLGLLLWMPVVLITAFLRARIGLAALYLPLGLLTAYFVMSYSDNLLFYLSAAWYYWAILGAVLGAAVVERASAKTYVQEPTKIAATP